MIVPLQSMVSVSKAYASAPQTGRVTTAVNPSALSTVLDTENARAQRATAIPLHAAIASVHFNGEDQTVENLVVPLLFHKLCVLGMVNVEEKVVNRLT